MWNPICFERWGAAQAIHLVEEVDEQDLELEPPGEDAMPRAALPN
jgi:hypothetical protein